MTVPKGTAGFGQGQEDKGKVKLFITGISGLLGLNLALQFKDVFDVTGSYHRHPVRLPGVETFELDLAQPANAKEVLTAVRPDVIIHTAALANVETCETRPEMAHQMNVEYSDTVANLARSLGAHLVSISTDQLFQENSRWTAEETEPAPINTYGRTKLLAERAVLEACPGALVIRTNFFGWGTPVRTSFSDWIIGALERDEQLTMFQDVFFSPILINTLGDLIAELMAARIGGVLHVGGGERLSKHGFALSLARVFGYGAGAIQAIDVADFNFKARRPRDMSLSVSKVESLLQTKMPTVTQSLERLKVLREDGWAERLSTAMDIAPSYL